MKTKAEAVNNLLKKVLEFLSILSLAILSVDVPLVIIGIFLLLVVLLSRLLNLPIIIDLDINKIINTGFILIVIGVIFAVIFDFLDSIDE
jgi:uncharacterized membrane protein (DUF485 family)